MKSFIFPFLLLILLSRSAFAQDASFEASVAQTTVATGEQFALSFTCSGTEMNSMKNFRAPDFNQFVVLSGPNQSTNMQIVNNSVSATIIYTYYLSARQPGKFSIGSASIEYKGKTLKTKALQIEVVLGKPKPKEAQAQPASQEIGDNLFIRATTDKQRVRQGEQLVVTYKLYTRLGVSGYDIARAPVYQGFWSEEVEQPRQPVVTTEVIDGKQFRVATMRKTALFPTQSGKLTVSPLEVRCMVQVQTRQRSNDPFELLLNDFSRVQTVEHEIKSNPLTITVDPLPGTAPVSYTGAVGKFSFSATVDKKSVKTGDPVTLRLSVSGTGVIKLLSLPKPALPSDFEAYEPKISEESKVEGGLVRGKKTAEYLVIPRNAGERTIEPIPFSYFDLESGGYRTLTSQRFDLSVAPGKEFATGTNIAAKSDVRLLGEDIRFLKLDLGQTHQLDESPFNSGWFLAVLILPPLFFIGAFLYRRRTDKLTGNIWRLRAEKAGKEAARRLKSARKILAQGNSESFYAEVSKALTGYLEDKLRIPRASFSLDDALVHLKEGGVHEEICSKVKSCFEQAEFVRFAPASDTQEGRTELLNTAADVINTVEKLYTEQS
ncbi:MAG: BatD family protein [bacterium]